MLQHNLGSRMGEFEIGYWGAFVGGLLSFISPCVLPLVPPYLCYLSGVTFEQISAQDVTNKTLKKRVLLTSIVFVLGFSTVFISLGATASWVGQFVAEYFNILSIIAGIIIIVFGLHFLGIFKIMALFRDIRFDINEKPRGLLGGYIIGVAFAFGWTPCIGPVLAAILMVAGSENSLGRGASLLAFYSFGIGLPFIGAALAIRPFINFMRRFQSYMKIIEQVIGSLLVITGILFLTNNMNQIGYWIQQTFPSISTIG